LCHRVDQRVAKDAGDGSRVRIVEAENALNDVQLCGSRVEPDKRRPIDQTQLAYFGTKRQTLVHIEKRERHTHIHTHTQREREYENAPIVDDEARTNHVGTAVDGTCSDGYLKKR